MILNGDSGAGSIAIVFIMYVIAYLVLIIMTSKGIHGRFYFVLANIVEAWYSKAKCIKIDLMFFGQYEKKLLNYS